MLDIQLSPGRRELRQFGFVAAAAFLLLAGLVHWRGGVFGIAFGEAAPLVVGAALAVGAASLLFSLIAPGANRPLYVGLAVATYPIGWVLSHVLLAALFYGILTPLGLFFRWIGRDPLRRRFDPEAPSYWEPHQKVTDRSRYFKQF